MDKFFRSLGVLLISLLLVVAVVQPSVSAEQEDREQLPVKPGFYGYPLKIYRILKPDHPFPDVQGLYVTSVDPTSRVSEKRLDEEAVITKIAGRQVNYMPRIQEILDQSVGERIEIEGYRLTPSYMKQRRENPFFEFRGRNPYRRFTIEVTYPVRYEPEPDPVYAYQDGKLYHKLNYKHSPDTATALRLASPEEARARGLKPCPFGFPGSGGGSEVTDLVEDELPGGAGVLKKLKKKFGRVRELPDEMVRLRDKIFPQRLRTEVTPRIVYLDTEEFYGLSDPEGQILISRGLWQFLEFEQPQAFLLACLLGHFDFKHRFGLPGEEYLFDIIKRGVSRVTGQVSGLKVEHFSKVEQMLPVYLRTSYRSMIEKGYSETEEKQALFLGMVYLHRAGMKPGAVRNYLTYIEDVLNYPHPERMQFQLQRPLPERFRAKVKDWMKLIPKKFGRSSESSAAAW